MIGWWSMTDSLLNHFWWFWKKDWKMCTDCLKVRAAEVALADSYESVRTSSLYVHQIGFCHPQDHCKNQPNSTRWVRLWTTSSKSMTNWKAHVSRLPRCHPHEYFAASTKLICNKEDQIKDWHIWRILEAMELQEGIKILLQQCRLRMYAVASVVRWFPGSQWVEAEAPRLAGAFLRHDLQLQPPWILKLDWWFVWFYCVNRPLATSIFTCFHDSLLGSWLCFCKSNSCVLTLSVMV